MKKIKKVVAAVKKVGTLNLVLILVGAFFVWFNWQMILVFREYGSMPETYACAVVAERRRKRKPRTICPRHKCR